MSEAGGGNKRVEERMAQLNITDFSYDKCPVTFWDVFAKSGHPVRTTIAEMVPLLFARMLNLNDVQSGVLNAVFKIADDQGLLLLDLKDLRTMMQHASSHAAQYQAQYGNISAASVGAIQRGLLQLETEGADQLFGEPALNLDDLIQTDARGRGVINILASDQLFNSPRIYATLLLWLLSELFEKLPEAGDLDKPKLVFFFDEAHLLFKDAPKALLDRIEQVVRLIRSKAVGVYFVSQNPLDIPDVVLGQLGNRVQHALRAFTPRDQKAVKSAAETFRGNPGLDVAAAITEMGVGEALVSFLDSKGIPSPVERTFIVPPMSRIGPATDAEREATIKASALYGFYENVIDRESAHEILQKRAEETAQQAAEDAKVSESTKLASRTQSTSRGREPDGLMEIAAKTVVRTIGSQLGRQIVRGILGSIMGGKK
jgi:uncharacterized protein